MTLVLGGLAIMLATTLAGVLGFAYGLVSLPLLLALGYPLPEVVVVNLTTAMLVRTVTLWQLRHDVTPRRSSLLVAASVPGLVVGVLVRDSIDTEVLTFGAAGITLVAAAVLAIGSAPGATKRMPPNGGALMGVAGMLGGFLGTTTSLNGIPPAIVFTYFRMEARNVVADMAGFFVVGNAITLALLSVSGSAPMGSALPLVAGWLPGAIIGNVVGVRLGPRIPYETFRRVSLVVIFVSGLTPVISLL